MLGSAVSYEAYVRVLRWLTPVYYTGHVTTLTFSKFGVWRVLRWLRYCLYYDRYVTDGTDLRPVGWELWLLHGACYVPYPRKNRTWPP